MTPTANVLIDQAGVLLWLACLHSALFGTALLVPIAIWRQRPAVRHFLALSALVAALVSPLTAAAALRLGLDWAPIPAPLQIVDRASMPAIPDASGPHLAAPELSTAPGLQAPESDDHLADQPAISTDSRTQIGDGRDVRERSQARPPEVARERRDPRPTLLAPVPANSGFTTPTPLATRAKRDGPNATRHVVRAGLAVWLIGALALCARVRMTQVRLNQLIGLARPVTDQSVIALVERAAARLKLATVPQLLASKLVTNPFVAGARRPRILIPELLLAPDCHSEFDHTIVHECGHIARHDLWIGSIQRWASVLIWPNPLVHLHAAILAGAREELCDNYVLLSSTPAAYARTLLSLAERLSGLSGAAAVALCSRRQSLSARIAGLLDPRRDRAMRLGSLRRAMLAVLTIALAAASAGVGRRESSGNTPATAPGQTNATLSPPTVADTPTIVRELAARATNWTAAPSAITTLEYELVSGSRTIALKATRGERRRYSVWMGTTLQTAFRELINSPEKFDIQIKRQAGAATLTLLVKLKDDKQRIGFEAGNGVENSWIGYISHSAREATIQVDAARLVPLEERIGSTTVRYSGWQATSNGKWIPRQIDVIGSSAHFRMHFDWLGDTLWLLRTSESITPEATVALTRTRNVKINGRDVAAASIDAERHSHEAAQQLLAMLDHNRPWLDGGATGSGWRPQFRTLSYSFHTVREDVRESCVLSRDGEAAFEVSHDGQGKMKDQIGSRKIALNTQQHATSQRGARFACVYDRPLRERDQPLDLALKQYARIGCQFDLPLFRYRDQLGFAIVTIADGTWSGQPCRIATVSNLGAPAYLGCGTMLAFTSWSYVHHIAPSKEIIYIDQARNVPIHETLVSSRDNRTFEIDFGDYVQAEPGHWAPRSIRIEAKDYFTCEYQFQLVAGTHWMLDHVISWFKPEEKSRGVIEDVRVDKSQEKLDEALRQVETTRTHFRAARPADSRVDVRTVPFVLGRATQSGPYEIRVSMDDSRTVVVSASTNDAAAADAVPLCFLDAKNRLIFAAPITLADKDGVRRGSASFRASRAWRTVRSMSVPIVDASARRLPVSVVPFRWGESLAVNIPDANEGEIAGTGNKQPRNALTRAWQARVDRAGDGTAKLTLDLVSIDGPREFHLDIAAALLGESGVLVSCGHLSTSLRVVSEPVEQRFEIPLGKARGSSEPKYLAIGIAPGDVLSAPMGSRWGMLVRTDLPFDEAALLTAQDENCQRIGLAGLDRLDERRIGNAPHSRATELNPFVAALIGIVGTTTAADVKARAARLLAYSEAPSAALLLEPLAADPVPQVREAAAIGLTFLGRPGHLEVLRSILGRQALPLERNGAAEIDARRAFDRLESDTLIALAHQHSDTAIDLLGETLLADLEGLRPAPAQAGQTHLQGRSDRAIRIGSLLGHTGNPHAVRWLVSAADLIDRRPDLAEHFDQSELAQSMLRFKEHTRDRIAAELEKGKFAALWANELRNSDDPYFLKATRAMVRRNDVTSSAAYSAVRYLWNVQSAEAVDGLRDVYERGLMRDEPTLWIRVCEALAARGDGRGLADAYDILVGRERSAQPPADEKARGDWQRDRESQQTAAEEVFGKAPKDILAEFLSHKTETVAPEERRVVLRLLWRLADLPAPLAAVIPQWAQDGDQQVAELAKRALGRK
jgi:beta-lactamase regulating signal transducer with metallopeptidase domain